jgi:hypothetical protein
MDGTRTGWKQSRVNDTEPPPPAALGPIVASGRPSLITRFADSRSLSMARRNADARRVTRFPRIG